MKKYRFFFLILSILISSAGHSQRAGIYVKLIDSSSSNASDFVFNIRVQNISFDKYWMQDTSFLKGLLEHPTENLIHPYLKKKAGGVFKAYEHFKYRPGAGERAKCLDSCCNCIFLNKGESLQMNLPILKGYEMEKGEYRLQVTIGPPLFSCHACKQLGEIDSKYVYFTVN